MPVNGRVGGLFVPTIDEEGNIITSMKSDEFEADGITTEYQLSNRLILRDKSLEKLKIYFWDSGTQKEAEYVIGDETDVIGDEQDNGISVINVMFETEEAIFQTHIKINYLTGEIKLRDPVPSDIDKFVIDYEIVDELEQVGGFFEWTFIEGAHIEPMTDFGDEIISYKATLGEWEAAADKYWVVDDRFNDLIGEEIVIAFYIDVDTGTRFEGWGTVENVDTTCPIDMLVERDIGFRGQSILEFRN